MVLWRAEYHKQLATHKFTDEVVGAISRKDKERQIDQQRMCPVDDVVGIANESKIAGFEGRRLNSQITPPLQNLSVPRLTDSSEDAEVQNYDCYTRIRGR